MDVSKIIEHIWGLLGKNNRKAANITTKENEIIVNILTGDRWKRYEGMNEEEIILSLKNG